jgi:hypothetical protein
MSKTKILFFFHLVLSNLTTLTTSFASQPACRRPFQSKRPHKIAPKEMLHTNGSVSVKINDTVKVEPTANKRAKKEPPQAGGNPGTTGSVVPSADKKEPASSVKKELAADQKKQAGVFRVNEHFRGISNGMVSKDDPPSYQGRCEWCLGFRCEWCLGLSCSKACELEGTVSSFNADAVNRLLKQARYSMNFYESTNWNDNLLTLASKAPSASSALVLPGGVSILVASSSMLHGSGSVSILNLTLTLTT